MQKRIIAMLLAASMIICLTACGTTNDEATTQTTEPTDMTEMTIAEENTAPSMSYEEPSYEFTQAEENNGYVQPTENQIQPNTPNTPNTPAHTHYFSPATCTAPQRCSCGATIGAPLGHNFSAATCTSPKTCSRCGITQGSALGHNYVNNKCTRCGKTDPNSLPVGLEKLTVIDSAFYQYKSGSVTDAFGNSYSSGAHHFRRVYESNNGDPPYAIFNLDGKYKTFTGSIVSNPQTGNGWSWYLQIFVDDQLVYSKSGITLTSGRIDFSANVKNGRLLKITCGIEGHSAGDNGFYIVNAKLYK